MAATVARRLEWQLAEVREIVVVTYRVKSLVLHLTSWQGHLPGQHVDIRLTAADGYQAQRSYSIASPPEDELLTLTVEQGATESEDKPRSSSCGSLLGKLGSFKSFVGRKPKEASAAA